MLAGLHRTVAGRPGWCLLVGTAVVVTACSSGGDGGAAGTISMDEFAFRPESTTVAGGPEAVLELRNVGTVTHDWTLLSRSIAAESELTDDVILVHVVVAAGDTSSASLEDIAPDTYQFVCAIPEHLSLGMRGILVVAGPD